jgi:hypothetical protein
MAKQDYDEACGKFRESLELDPAVGTTLNLADCEEHRGKLPAAWALFQDALRKLQGNDDRRPIASKRIKDLESKLGVLTVKLVADAPEGTKVKVDGKALEPADLGTARAVDPGEHTIAVDAPDGASHTVTVRLGAGERLEREVGPNAPGASDGGGSDARLALGLVSAGVGASLIVTGIATGVMTVGKKHIAVDNCPDNFCNSTGSDAVKSGRTLAAVSTATLILGGAAVVTSIIVLTTGGSKKSSAVLVPAIGPRMGGLWVTGRF